MSEQKPEEKGAAHTTSGGSDVGDRVFRSTCGRGLKLSTDGRSLVVASRRVASPRLDSRDGEKRRRRRFLFPRGPRPYGAGLTEGGSDAERRRRDATRRTAPRRPFGPAFTPLPCVCARVAPISRLSETLCGKIFVRRVITYLGKKSR